MNLDHRLRTLLCLLALACDSTDPQTAGGQSGTDANGGYDCAFNFVELSGEEVALEEPVEGGLSPNDFYDRLDGAYSFTCEDGVKYAVSFSRGDAARTVLGRLNESEPSELCAALQLDAEVQLHTEDGAWSYEASFVTANLLGNYEIGGRIVDTEGRELWITLMQGASQNGSITRMRLDWPKISTTHCVIPSDETGAGESDG
jgi:hypothetical protein